MIFNLFISQKHSSRSTQLVYFALNLKLQEINRHDENALNDLAPKIQKKTMPLWTPFEIGHEMLLRFILDFSACALIRNGFRLWQ